MVVLALFAGMDSTEISVDDNGWESHPSWVTLRANTINASPGVRLHDSDVAHRKFVRLTLTRAQRRRELNSDWIHAADTIVEVDMSMAQWGAVVSSFGDGSGVPVTLSLFDGDNVPVVTEEDSRIAVSIDETRQAAKRMVADIAAQFAALEEAFESRAGRRELAEKMRDLHHTIGNTPANVAYAAKSLSEHVENVVTKARADIEGMVAAKAETLGLNAADVDVFELGAGPTD